MLYSRQNARDSEKRIAFIGRVFYTLFVCSWFLQNVSNYHKTTCHHPRRR